MSHYDIDTEMEEEIRRKAYEADTRRRLKLLEKFRSELEMSIIPRRFKDSLEDLENWLKAQL